MTQQENESAAWPSDAQAGTTRRDAMKGMAGAALGVATMGPAVFAQPAQADFSSIKVDAAKKHPAIPQWKTELKQLAPNVYAYNQSLDVKVPVNLANCGMIAGPNYLMAIDSMAWPLHVKAFIQASKQATSKDFGLLLNTHQHGDHVLGNQFFAGMPILSHEYCRGEVLKMKGGNRLPKIEGQAEGTETQLIAPPTLTMRDRLAYDLGDIHMEIMWVGRPAHTWGDVMVHLPDHKILFAADIAFHYVTPVAQNGHVSSWIETVDKILEMKDVDFIVPGHGLLGGKKELADMREYYVTLKREARKYYDRGVSAGRAAAEIDMGKYELWARSERACTNVVRLYEEFAGRIKPETEPAVQRKAMEEFLALRKMTPPSIPPA